VGRRVGAFVITAASLALVSPVLFHVYRDVDHVGRLAPGWLLALAVSVVLHFLANWELHRIVLRTDRWFDVAVPQLVGNAASHLTPAGAAVGAGVQLRMMVTAGFPVAETVTALSIVTVLGTFAGLVVLPLIVFAASAAGSNVAPTLTGAMWTGAAVLAGILALTVAAVARDAPWRRLAGAVAWTYQRLHLTPTVDLSQRLLRERDLIRSTLRQRLPLLVVVVLGRALGDYATLYIALLAVHGHVNPAAALAAFVEGSLVGVLRLAGATRHHANVAVALYRIAATWLPCLAGGITLFWFRARHAGPYRPSPSTDPLPVEPPAGHV
jgi:uncharacterized membrane protein YbhN (UPF0104 family)